MQKQPIRQNIKKNKKSYSESEDLVKKNILGVGVTNASKENILEYIVSSVKNFSKPYYVVTPNPEILVRANKNSNYRDVLNHAKIASNDGVGVSLAASLLGQQLQGRTTGLELVENLCEKCNDWPITVGFLGGGPNIAEMASECLKHRYPKLQVVFADSEEDKLLKLPKSVMPDVLFIALGAPKQELWMAEHLGKIPVKVMIGVGGAFDQIVHPSLRPPAMLQHIGLGWLYRLIRQPWRWKRQLALIEFMWLVLREKFSFSS